MALDERPGPRRATATRDDDSHPAHGQCPAGVLKALSDPVRWSIVKQLGEVDELACSVLEHTLNLSKPTISYHTKILLQAGLMTARKDGRNLLYTLRPEALRDVIEDIWGLAPGPVPVTDGILDFRPTGGRRNKAAGAPVREGLSQPQAAGAENTGVVLTW